MPVARRIVFVNGHGGNGRTLVEAVRLLRYEGRDVAWFACGHPAGDAHAGDTETSVLLHLTPGDVQIGQKVQVEFNTFDGDLTLAQFRPVG